MSKLVSDLGNEYTTRDVSRDAFTVRDSEGNTSTYAFEDDGSALEHINSTESNGKGIDSL